MISMGKCRPSLHLPSLQPSVSVTTQHGRRTAVEKRRSAARPFLTVTWPWPTSKKPRLNNVNNVGVFLTNQHLTLFNLGVFF